MRQYGSLLVLIPVTLAHPDRRRLWGVFRPQRSWLFSLPGTALGSFVALLLWIAGMKYIPAGKAAILNQTSTIYLLLLATLLLKEPFTRRKILAAGLAFSGVLLVLEVL
jgi:drug/metabolite transporter (DMT)-like permease